MKLRGQSVFARVDDSGRPLVEGGRVEIRYNPNDGRAYGASSRNLEGMDGPVFPDSHCGDAAAAPKKGAKKKSKKSAGSSSPAPSAPKGNEVLVYTDGACSGNPGPAGTGVVMIWDDERRELSEFLGRGTNNVAELTGILRAAESTPDKSRPLRLYTDSTYSIGVLTKGWKAKKNVELIAKIKEALAELDDVELHYVKGHAGIPLNERADQLAVVAVEARASSGWISV